MNGLPVSVLLYCRAGFEKECGHEVLSRALERNISGYLKASPNSGYVVFVPHNQEDMGAFRGVLKFKDLIFARQLVFVLGFSRELKAGDRIEPLIKLAQLSGLAYADVFLETPDTNESREMQSFFRKFEKPFRSAFKRYGLLKETSRNRLHLFFLNSSEVYLGFSDVGNSSRWCMGIPRLKFPGGAPSRSTLKLEEALMVFLDKDKEADLQPGMTAVDLGASPGGWTYQLVRRHIKTIAIDNGPMDARIMESGLVEHLRVDGLSYRPRKPVDWMVCDIVEQPSRIARLVGQWIALGYCRNVIFNLKLPMKKRYEEVEICREIIRSEIVKRDKSYKTTFKQLYHDRAEITGYISRDAR